MRLSQRRRRLPRRSPHSLLLGQLRLAVLSSRSELQPAAAKPGRRSFMELRSQAMEMLSTRADCDEDNDVCKLLSDPSTQQDVAEFGRGVASTAKTYASKSTFNKYFLPALVKLSNIKLTATGVKNAAAAAKRGVAQVTGAVVENEAEIRKKWKNFTPGFAWGETVRGSIIRAGNLRYRSLAEAITSQRTRKVWVAPTPVTLSATQELGEPVLHSCNRLRCSLCCG